jgi:hypothetical protein
MVRTATKKQLADYIHHSIRFLTDHGETAAALARRLGVTKVYIGHARDGERGAGKKLVTGFRNEFHAGSEEELHLAALQFAKRKQIPRDVLLGTAGGVARVPTGARRLSDFPAWAKIVGEAKRGGDYLPEYAYDKVGELSVPFAPNITPEWVRQTVLWYLAGTTPVEREHAEADYARRELERKRGEEDPLLGALTTDEITQLRRLLTGKSTKRKPLVKR